MLLTVSGQMLDRGDGYGLPDAGEGRGSPMKKDWLTLLLALACTVVPLAFLDISAGQWLEGSRGATVVNEHLKFAAFLFLGCLPVVLMGFTLADGRARWSLPPGYLLPAGLLAFACVFSSVRAVDAGRHWMTAWQVFLLPLLLFLAVGSQKWKPAAALRVMLALLPAGVVVAVMGLDQFYQWPCVSLGDVLPHYQLGSMLYSQNLAAEYLALLLPLAFACAVAGPRKLRWLCLLVGGVMLLFFVLTRARAAWVGLVGGVVLAGALVLWHLLRQRQMVVARAVLGRMGFLTLGLAGGFLLLLLLTPYWATGFGDDPPGPNEPLQADRFVTEFKSIFEGQSNARREIWADSWRLGREAGGIIGVGAGQFRIQFPRFIHASQGMFEESLAGPKFKQTRRAHNDYLQLLVELGLVGLMAGLWLWGRVLIGAVRTAGQMLQTGELAGFFTVFGLLASVLTLAVTMFFDFPSRMPATIAVGWTCLGLLAGMEIRSKPSCRIRGDGSSLVALLSIFTLVVSWSLGWRTVKGDFYRVQGGLALGVGDYASAKEYYQIARAHQPWEDDPWLRLYWLHRREFQMERALETVQGHLARNPWYYLPMKYEKECLMQLGRWEEARASVRRILEVYPGHPHRARLQDEVGIHRGE